MSPRDAHATKARILRAATAEFAEHGYAGGRVDRIVREAGTNVRMIYAYFSGKDGLFDAAVAGAVESMAAAVPPRVDDLPAWAGELFDYHRREPTTLRITMWAHLERPEAAAEPVESYVAKTTAVSGVDSAPLTAVDLLVFVYALAQAWYLTPTGLLRADGSDPADPQRVADHRAAIVAAVDRLVHPAR
ncbi:TetR family transcriptional regulator [Actinokineospora bangkokensis]|uniref:TetR family transcriptional regulator n=1 Tax=Actinokineospora bangkokensis TaxID=1193682 RepID=A0A1Q9LKP7_9PSEU|nr:TetR family transcriptional regulator [Actinokineospora bangkokensis]OLR92627.1 TetR family transcriptional regulator [Actinokineospora bangkokensis]